MTYLWADTHFNHRGIIGHANRPYDSIWEMNNSLVERWNAVVGLRTPIWVLGDFGFATKDGEDLWGIFGRLNGTKSLIVGNHDERNPEVLKLPWDRVERLFTLKEDGMRAELCHYPMETWKGSHTGTLMLHGHSHGTLKTYVPRRFDVGADVLHRPLSLAELWHIGQQQDFVAFDHHGA